MNWLQELVNQHKEYESPSSFWWWSGLFTISAVVKDNVWLDKYLYKLYPNIYVMLHADSGLRKSAPVSMAKQLVRLVNNTRVISGRSSIQAILKELGTAYTIEGKGVQQNSTAAIIASELTSSMVDDPAAMSILTDLYDRQYNNDEWKSLLKMETFSLKNPTVCSLSATNEAHSSEYFGNRDMHGGYFARTFIIYDNKPNTVNSLMYPPKVPTDYEYLAEYLKEVSELKGEFILQNEAREYFDHWYHEFRRMILEQEIKDDTGTLNRFDDSVLKVAMLLSLANQPDLVIDKHIISEAIEKCTHLIGSARRTSSGKGKSNFAMQKGTIIFELLRRDPPQITRAQINKKYYAQASTQEWDDIMKQLEVAGVIDSHVDGIHTMYVMKPDQYEKYYKFYEGKMK